MILPSRDRPAKKKTGQRKVKARSRALFFFSGQKKHKPAFQTPVPGNTIPFLDVRPDKPMPTKRRYGESLTGGTGDVNPQTYTIVANLPVADGSDVAAFPVPIPRYPGGADRAVIMELLGVSWYLSGLVPTFANGDTYQLTAAITTDPAKPTTGQSIVANPRSLSVFRRHYTSVQATAVGFTVFSPVLEEYDDLTDKAGHGILVATDNIYLSSSVALTNYGAPLNATAVLNYRMKEVGLKEYIGIVTSQQ